MCWDLSLTTAEGSKFPKCHCPVLIQVPNRALIPGTALLSMLCCLPQLGHSMGTSARHHQLPWGLNTKTLGIAAQPFLSAVMLALVVGTDTELCKYLGR